MERSWLVRRWWAIAIALVMVYAFPHYPSIRSANELPRLYLVMAMADDQTFAIDEGVARWGATADVSPSGGHQYSNKAPGSSMLAVPAYVALRGVTHVVAGREPTLGEMMWTVRIWTGVIPTLLFLWLLWGFLRRFTPDDAIGLGARRATIAIYGIGSMALTYSVLFISHQLSAVCIGAAWILCARVVDDGRDPRWMIAAGALAGAAPLVDYQALFAAVPIAVWVLIELFEKRRSFMAVVWAVAGAAAPIAILLYYHDACFGSPFKTGYAASQTFAHFHQKGFLGMDQLRWEAFTGSTIAPDNGLFVFCPALLLALPGWVLMARRRLHAQVAVTAAIAVIYLLFISSITFWRGGWQMGPRYITVMLPFLLPAIAVAIASAGRWPALRGAALGLGGVGVFVYTASIALFPHFPEKFKNPLYEVTLRLAGDGLAAPNLGMIAGLPGAWSLVPFALVVLAVWGAAVVGPHGPWRPRLVTAAVSVAVSAAIVIAYSGFAGGGKVAEQAYARTVAPAVRSQMPQEMR
ncbi:MAG TPA: hypothetical protein VM261_07865 [Kofleriaceae bacterium]|nr:hypothetical protein [Kofleriaceae bacterium]